MRFIVLLLFIINLGYADKLRNVVRGDSPSTHQQTQVINSNGVRIVVRYPNHVYAGGKFTIYASMTNNIDDARMGGLTLSFPQYSSMDANILSKRFDKLNGYLPPSKLYSRVYNRNTPIDYYVIEGWENRWDYRATKHMKLQFIAPHTISHIDINVRGVIIFGKGRHKEEIAVPLRSSIYDQQGYPVRQITIDVLK